ncbi:MAG: cytochrome C [Telluria sp.]
MQASNTGAAVLSCIALACFVAAPAAQAGQATRSNAIERGRYLVSIAGCNDCHTPGYSQAGGNIAQEQWLVGDHLGWRGPWGTTYPTNLRLYMQTLSEDEWLKVAKTAVLRPPMPWFNLRSMTNQDLSAIYRYVRFLGPAGKPAPAYMPPGQQPKGPYVQFP